MSEEVEVKVLKKHMGGVDQMLKDLKNSVKVLEKRLDDKEDKEIKEIIDAQAIIEDILVANDDAIKQMDKEIEEVRKGC